MAALGADGAPAAHELGLSRIDIVDDEAQAVDTVGVDVEEVLMSPRIVRRHELQMRRTDAAKSVVMRPKLYFINIRGNPELARML